MKKKQKNKLPKEIKIPVKIAGSWFCCFLYKNGKIEKSANTGFIKKKNCKICCDNYNKFVGFKKKQVKELIKEIQNGKEKEKTGKRKIIKNKSN